MKATKPPILLALSVLSCFRRGIFPYQCLAAAEAFAHPFSAAFHQKKRPRSQPDHLFPSPTRNSEVDRRGGAVMKSTAAASASEDESAKRQRDLESMRRCYKAAFFSTAVDVYDTLLRDRQQSLRTIFTSWASGLDFISSLHILGLGVGIAQISNLYIKESKESDLLSLVRTMRAVWFNAWIVLTLGTMALSTALTGNHYSGPATVAAIALASSIEISLTQDSTGTTSQESTTTGESGDDVLKQTRATGWQVGRNMRLCMVAFVVDGMTRLAVTLSNANTSIVEKALGMLDVLEPIIVFALLRSLYKAYGPALLRATDPRTAGVDEGYANLYEAETGFYSKIAKVLFFPAMTKLLSPPLVSLYEIVKARYM